MSLRIYWNNSLNRLCTRRVGCTLESEWSLNLRFLLFDHVSSPWNCLDTIPGQNEGCASPGVFVLTYQWRYHACSKAYIVETSWDSFSMHWKGWIRPCCILAKFQPTHKNCFDALKLNLRSEAFKSYVKRPTKKKQHRTTKAPWYKSKSNICAIQSQVNDCKNKLYPTKLLDVSEPFKAFSKLRISTLL